MKPTGRYKLTNQRKGRSDLANDLALPTALIGGAMRAQRIVDSLRAQVAHTEAQQWLRVRQIFSNPREIYRIEYEVPALSYQRTTLLDRESLEELLEDDRVRQLVARGLDAVDASASPALGELNLDPEKEADAV